MHENREISSAPWSDDQGRSAKAKSRTADMHVLEKSDGAVVPVNQPNKEGKPSVEVGEGRVVGFQHRTEAERFLKEFRERLARFGLELHPGKTRLIEFGRFAARDRKARGVGKPETFTFLGFTHYCGQRHKSGTFTVWRITAKKRMVAKLKAIKAELQRRRHDRMAEVGAWLRKVVLGYYQYHAVPGNTTQLRIFKLRVCRLWQSVLVRRSQRVQMRWERLTPVLNRWIPPPRVLHPYPDARFYATHPS